MRTETVKLLRAYADKMPPCPERGKVFGIASKIERLQHLDIASCLIFGHSSCDGPHREASYLVDAGAAAHEEIKPGCHGTYTFKDGSIL
jgi:hypothetical protein